MKRYEFSVDPRNNKIKSEEWQNGDYVLASDAFDRIAKLEKERGSHIDAMSIILDNWKRDVEKIEKERDEALAEVAKLKAQLDDIYRRL